MEPTATRTIYALFQADRPARCPTGGEVTQIIIVSPAALSKRQLCFAALLEMRREVAN